MSATCFQRMRRERKKQKLEPEKHNDISNMTVDELIDYAKEKGIDIGKSTSQKGILEKI